MINMIRKGKKKRILPTKLYFHAFCGKVGVVNSLQGICTKYTEVYNGFAHVINARSTKTKSVLKHIGIENIMLESDVEDESNVVENMNKGLEYLSGVFGEDKDWVRDKVWENSKSCMVWKNVVTRR